jgi:hypothetical protein
VQFAYLRRTILAAAKKSIPFGARRGPNKPFWNETCKEARLVCNRARKEAERLKTSEAVHEYNVAKREATRVIAEERRRSFEEMAEELDINSDLFGLLKGIRGEGPSPRDPAVINRPPPLRPAATDKEKAELFVKEYAAVSRVERRREDREIKKQARAALRKKCPCPRMCDPFTLGQLKGALRKLKTGKSPGGDGIYNEMLKNLPSCTINTMLSLFNDSWRSGDCPVDWRTAIIIPILKPRKSAALPASYRPVALTSCVAKVMERLVADRLSYFLESKGLLSPCQAGFRRGRSTEEQLARVCQGVFDGLERKLPERSALCLLDFSRAYDRVWKDALYTKLDKLGAPPPA